MGYSIITKNPPGIICISDVDFKCPNCSAEYGEDFYFKQLQKSSKWLIHKRCKKCSEVMGITTDMMGDVKVWMRKEEKKYD